MELERVAPPDGGGGGGGRPSRVKRDGMGFRSWRARWRTKPSRRRMVMNIVVPNGEGPYWPRETIVFGLSGMVVVVDGVVG